MDFSILEISRINIDKFRLTEILYDILFTNVDRKFEESVEIVRRMIDHLVDVLRHKMSESDKISLNFFHTQFQQPISIPFIRKKAFTKELVMNHIYQVAQSYKDLAVNPRNSLNAKAQIQKIPVGGGRRKLPENEKKNILKKPIGLQNNLFYKKTEKFNQNNKILKVICRE